MRIKSAIDKRPWGMFENLIQNNKCTVKILTVYTGKRFSLQYHKHRDENWVFLDNPARVTIGNKIKIMRRGDEAFIPRNTKHRIEALSKRVRVLEISTGRFNENDITRVEDDFGRV